MRELLGWSASTILVVTIVTQVYRQWQQGSSKGVSKWLFIGQIAASAGFLLYSWLIHDTVFVFTNALMLMSAIVGLGIVLWHRRKNSNGHASHPSWYDEEAGKQPPQKQGIEVASTQPTPQRQGLNLLNKSPR